MKIFVSYSDIDKDKMLVLEKAIQESNLGLIPVIVAKDKKPGVPLSDKVKDAIIGCDILVPIITNSSIKNQWVNQEIGFAYAKDRSIYPLVNKKLFSRLKGFINNQIDLPFGFEQSFFKYREDKSFEKSYKNLLDYLAKINITPLLDSSISPEKIIQGEKYTTKVSFKGKLKHGFFDNLVRHQDSVWKIWNWDSETLPNSSPINGGKLEGDINIEKQYTHSTKNWPKGRHTIYVRVYDHPIIGEKGRNVIAENIHEIEII